MGSGTAALSMFVLGATGQLDVGSVGALCVIMAISGAAVLFSTKGWRWAFSFLRLFRVARSDRLLFVLLFALLVPFTLLHALDLMMPVTEFDSTLYHMSAAKLYRQTNALAYQENLRLNAQPHLAVLLYLRHWILLDDDSIAKLINLEFYFVLLLLFAYASRRFRCQKYCVVGFLFLAASPVFCWLAKVEYLDLALAAYFTAAVMVLLQSFGRMPTRFPLLAGILLGFAAACKYQGLVLAAAALGAFLAISIKTRGSWRRTVGNLILMLLLVTLIGLPWWVRSYVNTGALWYPFLSPEGLEDTRQWFATNELLGVGRNLGSFFFIGYHVATKPAVSFGDPFSFGPTLLLLQAAILLLLPSVRKVRQLPDAVLLAVLTASLYFLFWFFTGQVLRYLASIMPLLSILFLLAMKQFLGVRRTPVFLMFLMAVLASHATFLTSTIRRCVFFPPVTFAQKEVMLFNVLPYYPAVQKLNATTRETDRVYLLFAEQANYYVDSLAYGDWFGRYNFMHLFRNAGSFAGVLDHLRRAGFDYVLIDRFRTATFVSTHFAGFADADLVKGEASFPETTCIFRDERFSVLRLH